jgi:hypothetical protein
MSSYDPLTYPSERIHQRIDAWVSSERLTQILTWCHRNVAVGDWDYHAHAEPMLGDEAKVIRLYFLNEADAEAFQRRWD